MNDAQRPLRRLIPKRTWTDAHGLGLLLWVQVFVLGGLFSLILITLFVDLLVTQGRLPEAQVESYGIAHKLDWLGSSRDLGLWTQAIRYRDLLGWSWLSWFCTQFPFVQSSQNALVLLTGLGLLAAIIIMFARVCSRAHAQQTARQIATSLQKSIHRQTLRLGPSDLSGQRHLTASKLFTETVDEIREALIQYRWRLVRGVCLIPAMFAASLVIDVRLALQCLLPTAACWWLSRYERNRGAARRLLAESHAETEARFLADGLKKTRIVRGYNIEAFEGTLFDNHITRITSETTTGIQLESQTLRFARVVVAAAVAIVLLLIGLRVLSATDPLPLASAIALTATLSVIALEANSLAKGLSERRNLIICSDRTYRFLDEIPEVGQAVGAKFIQPVSKSIILEAVHSHHRGHEMLRGVDLRIEALSQVSLVSLDPLLPKAIAYLLPRFMEPSKGRVLFDGEDIAWGTLESIHAETLYVGGDDPVLSGSVLENLICGDTRFSMQDAIEAAKLVHVNKFISGLPLGYETTLGERGAAIGIGEAFQIGLARAVLRDPAVLIIQEPEAILEDELRTAIDNAYQRIAAGRTVLFLPTRLSTIRRCDQVVLLHDGQVEGIGPHVELRKASELYRHWDYINFNSYSRESRRLQAADARLLQK